MPEWLNVNFFKGERVEDGHSHLAVLTSQLVVSVHRVVLLQKTKQESEYLLQISI